MTDKKTFVLPDVGDVDDVRVVELFVAEGDHIAKDDSLLMLEGSKASVEIPAPFAATIEKFHVAVGDAVKEKMVLATVSTEEAADSTVEEAEEVAEDTQPASKKSKAEKQPPNASSSEETSQDDNATTQESESEESVETVVLPDVGDVTDTSLVEVFIKAGDVIAENDSLIMIEGSKASVEVPSPVHGTVVSVLVRAGDAVQSAMPICTVRVRENKEKEDTPKQKTTQTTAQKSVRETTQKKTEADREEPEAHEVAQEAHQSLPDVSRVSGHAAHASPAVRRFARELGVQLVSVRGSGRKGRIVKEDVQQFVATKLREKEQHGTGGIPAVVGFDYAKYGTVESVPLSKIKKRSGQHLHACWLNVPHVTQFGEADITEMEAFRQSHKEEAAHRGVRLTPLVFIMKAIVSALKRFPQFNASLDEDKATLIVKQYYHIGVAVDTKDGLVVPVIRDVDKKGLFDLAGELGEVSERAREQKLFPADMQGGTFSLSSLGGIGGTNFTPIVNVPEVAILGISRATQRPVWRDGAFVPRLVLPLALSYDHRVIDGADGARFIDFLGRMLTDIRSTLL